MSEQSNEEIRVRVGRNDPCSCGSGLKFKRCCGDNAKLKLKRDEEHIQFMLQIQNRISQRRADRKVPIGVSAMLAAAMVASIKH